MTGLLRGPLIDKGPIPPTLLSTKNGRICLCIQDGVLNFPPQLNNYLNSMEIFADDITIDVGQEHNTMVWRKGNTGLVTVKDQYEAYRGRNRSTHWLKKLWQTYLPPKISVFTWKFTETAGQLKSRRTAGGSKCAGAVLCARISYFWRIKTMYC